MARHPPARGQRVNPATSCTLWGLRGFTRAAGGWLTAGFQEGGIWLLTLAGGSG